MSSLVPFKKFNSKQKINQFMVGGGKGCGQSRVRNMCCVSLDRMTRETASCLPCKKGKFEGLLPDLKA